MIMVNGSEIQEAFMFFFEIYRPFLTEFIQYGLVALGVIFLFRLIAGGGSK